MTPADRLRLAHIKWVQAYRANRLAKGTRAVQSVRHLIERVADPMVRTSFLNALACTLAAEGRYREAEIYADLVCEQAAKHRLDFALPHAFAWKAVIELGLR